MKKQYKVYSVSLEMPMLKENMFPGCTAGRKEDARCENIKIFDSLDDAELELKKHTSMVYPRFECRKAYYEVTEWYLDEVLIDENGNVEEAKNIGYAHMDLGYLEDQNDYMP